MPQDGVLQQEPGPEEAGGVKCIGWDKTGSSRQGAPSPARHSLPCPNPASRSTREGSDYGRAVPPGWIRRAERTRLDVSQSSGLRGPVARGMGSPGPPRQGAEHRCSAKMANAFRRRPRCHGFVVSFVRLSGRGWNLRRRSRRLLDVDEVQLSGLRLTRVGLGQG